MALRRRCISDVLISVAPARVPELNLVPEKVNAVLAEELASKQYVKGLL